LETKKAQVNHKQNWANAARGRNVQRVDGRMTCELWHHEEEQHPLRSGRSSSSTMVTTWRRVDPPRLAMEFVAPDALFEADCSNMAAIKVFTQRSE
jgi:hypothetical protein